MSEVMSRLSARTLLLNPNDNVAVALSTLDVGAETGQGGLRTTKRVPRGHKFTVRPVSTVPFASFSVTVAWAD